jgi:hypothetical protein
VLSPQGHRVTESQRKSKSSNLFFKDFDFLCASVSL